MPPQALAALATLVGIVPHGNRVELRLDRGAAEIVWVSPSAFRFRRVLEGALPEAKTPGEQPVEIDVEELPGVVRIRSKFVEVSIEKNGVLVRTRRPDGQTLLEDATEARPAGAGVEWERRMRPEARYYGLGPRADATFDLRGKTAQPDSPFLYSTLGWGEFHAAQGAYRFDFTGSEQYRVHAPAIDYYFYYGPSIKQVMEEHAAVRGPASMWTVATDRFGSWATLRTALLRIVQGAISAQIAPTLDLRPYASAPPELQRRARQLGSLVAEVSPAPLGMSDFRTQLANFFDVYAMEAHERGFPNWHPLPFQFPDDPECANHADEFMLGDEMLVAPIVAPGGTRSLYLPQGVWTNLETDEVFPGRRTITVTTEGLPVFARNGTIVPLESAGGMALHYFPKLGAEFFLLDEEGWTQTHAAPAGDEMRLEIEARKTRAFRWVVHHVERPKSVSGNPVWRYDAAKKRLEIDVKVAAGEDSIVNLVWEEGSGGSYDRRSRGVARRVSGAPPRSFGFPPRGDAVPKREFLRLSARNSAECESREKPAASCARHAENKIFCATFAAAAANKPNSRRALRYAAPDTLTCAVMRRLSILLFLALTAQAADWQSLFDGKTLTGWKESDFFGAGKVTVENGAITLGSGALTGITWAGASLPFGQTNYEVRVEAMKVKGEDFFASITFPVGESYCTWINGGWGGKVVGLSSVNGADAAHNETTVDQIFETGRWYTLRLRVTPEKIQAWIDEEPAIDFNIAKKWISLREGEIEYSVPFGIASYSTVARIRKIEWRPLSR